MRGIMVTYMQLCMEESALFKSENYNYDEHPSTLFRLIDKSKKLYLLDESLKK